MVEDGKVYVFHPKCALSKCLDVDNGGKENGTNLIIWKYHRSNNQRFQAKSVGNGYFIFQNLQSKTVIDVNGGETINETNIHMWELNYTDAQKWKVINAGDGYYSLQSKLNNNYYLDIQYSGTEDGTNVILYEGNKTDAQKFKIVEKILYKYRVGVKGLYDNLLLEKINITHAAFLIGTDLFEYGTDPSALIGSGLNYSNNTFDTTMVDNIIKKFGITQLTSNGYVRRRNCGKDPSFNWDKIGSILNGTTWTQPYELEECIIKDGTWTNDKYDALNHNCQDFVRFCLYIVGANQGTIHKTLPVFRPHKDHLY